MVALGHRRTEATELSCKGDSVTLTRAGHIRRWDTDLQRHRHSIRSNHGWIRPRKCDNLSGALVQQIRQAMNS